jgi:hypothetical protein
MSILELASARLLLATRSRESANMRYLLGSRICTR